MSVKNYIIIAMVAGIFVILLWGATWILIPMFFGNWSDRASFGDMFGVVNALFSGLAFAGIIITILLQRQELEDTRTEIRGQKEQLQKQNETLTLQNFENKFFQLLNLHHTIVKGIDHYKHSTHRTITGRDCFIEYYQLFKEWYSRHNAPAPLHPLEDQINTSYKDMFRTYQSDLGHYFRNLYHIIKFIDLSGIENKYFYTSLVRAQLSTYELLLLFYNCLSEYGNKKAKPLIEKYSLFKNLPIDSLIDIAPYKKEDHIALYSKEAFEHSYK